MRFFRKLRIKRRIRRAASKWNGDLQRIVEYAADAEDGCFRWNHLVWQEIMMWIRLDKQVTEEDFTWMAERRGFDQMMCQYLLEMLRHVGLSKLLPAMVKDLRQPID